VFENLNWWEIVGLLLIGLFIFGPERLPKVLADAVRMLRTVRQMARNATTELREELGTDLDIEDLNPKTFVRKHLLSEDDQDALTRPLRDAYAEVQDVTQEVNGRPRQVADRSDGAVRPTRFDADAT